MRCSASFNCVWSERLSVSSLGTQPQLSSGPGAAWTVEQSSCINPLPLGQHPLSASLTYAVPAPLCKIAVAGQVVQRQSHPQTSLRQGNMGVACWVFQEVMRAPIRGFVDRVMPEALEHAALCLPPLNPIYDHPSLGMEIRVHRGCVDRLTRYRLLHPLYCITTLPKPQRKVDKQPVMSIISSTGMPQHSHRQNLGTRVFTEAFKLHVTTQQKPQNRSLLSVSTQSKGPLFTSIHRLFTIHCKTQLDWWIDNSICLGYCHPIPHFSVFTWSPRVLGILFSAAVALPQSRAVPSQLPEREAGIVFVTEISRWVSVL